MGGRRLRVLADVGWYLPAQRGGSELALHGLLKWLAGRGHDVRVSVRRQSGVGRHVDGVWREHPGNAKRHDWWDWADVAVTQHTITEQACWFARRHDRPLVFYSHRSAQAAGFDLPDGTLVLWNSSAERGVWAGPQLVLYPPVWPDDYRVAALGDGRITQVNLSTLKGGELFWRLVDACPDRRFLGVVGAWTGPGDAQITRRGRVPSNVEVVGTTTDMRTVYGRCRLMLAASAIETFGRVPVEAAASGIPTVAHPTPGLREALGDAAVWCDRDDPAAWVEALGRFDDPQVWSEMSERARQRSSELARLAVEQCMEVEAAMCAMAKVRPPDSPTVAAPFTSDDARIAANVADDSPVRPLRVAFLGNFTQPWCSEVGWAETLERLGHTVVRLQENQQTWRTVEEQAQHCDLLWWTRTWGVQPERHGGGVLRRLHDQSVVTVSVHLDLYHRLRDAQIGDPFWQSEHVFTADGDPVSAAKFAAAGIDHHWFPPGITERQAVRAEPAPDRWPDVKVGFVGSGRGGYHRSWPWRETLLAALEDRYGPAFHHAGNSGEPVRLHDLAEFVATVPVIVGDTLCPKRHTRYWSDRYPELLGRGAFLVAPAPLGIDEFWTPGEHFVPYGVGQVGRLLRTVDDWLDRPDERDAMRTAAYEQTLKLSTYTHRISGMLELLADLHPQLRPGAMRRRLVTFAGPHGTAARFHLRAGLEDPDARMQGVDTVTVAEAWEHNDYRLDPAVRGRTFVDVGANIGACTVLAAKLGAARVIAVEPESRNRAMLVANVAENGLADVVTVDQRPAGDGRQKVTVHTTGGGAWSTVDPDGERTVSLAQLVADHDIPQGSWLKVDTEGAEEALLCTAPHDVLDRFERISFEFHFGCGCAPAGVKGERAFGRLMAHLAWTHRVESTWVPPADIGLVHCHRHGHFRP